MVMVEQTSYESLRGVRLGEIRAGFSARTRSRSVIPTFGWLAIDLIAYLAFTAAAIFVGPLWAKVIFGVLAGVGVAMLFIWGHDAAHGSLFRSDRVSAVLGGLVMLPSFNSYGLWQHGHNRVHHGFTSFSPIDWIWRPRTPAEYSNLGVFGRFIYRRERSVAGCSLHYLLRVWWPGVVRFRPTVRSDRRKAWRDSKSPLLFFALGVSLVAARYGGGPAAVATAVVLPFLVFAHLIAFITYLHHTHPSIPYFDDRQRWAPAIGQLFCSTVVRCSRITEGLTHNIMIHVPHHVDTRIPFYRLECAYNELEPSLRAQVHEYRFQWRTVRMIFRECKLFDFESQQWCRFGAVKNELLSS